METLTISHDDLQDILMQNTSNPIAEEEIIHMIKRILQEGGKVTCTLENIEIPVYLSPNGDIQLGTGIEK